MSCCSHLESSTKPGLKHRPIETKSKNRKQSQKKNTMNNSNKNFQLEHSLCAKTHLFLATTCLFGWRLAKAFATVTPKQFIMLLTFPVFTKNPGFKVLKMKMGLFFVPKKEAGVSSNHHFSVAFVVGFREGVVRGPFHISPPKHTKHTP